MNEVSLWVHRKMNGLAVFYSGLRGKGKIINERLVSVEGWLSSIHLFVMSVLLRFYA